MDLSGIIFAALALGWAVYLIPKALQHTDEVGVPRAVETFSQRMRVIGGARPAEAPQTPAAEAPVAQSPAVQQPVRALPTRAAARKAAARRRTVLYVLLGLTVVVSVLAGLSLAPVWTPGIPVFLIGAFLFIARTTVKRERAGRVVAPAPVAEAPTTVAVTAEAAAEVVDDTEDTVGVDRTALEAALSTPVLDEGSLWDPLPVTLPTYVSKPTARRTVRTIELTQTAMTSSGHDAADSALVREAKAREAEAKQAEAAADEAQAPRKAAGA